MGHCAVFLCNSKFMIIYVIRIRNYGAGVVGFRN